MHNGIALGWIQMWRLQWQQQRLAFTKLHRAWILIGSILICLFWFNQGHATLTTPPFEHRCTDLAGKLTTAEREDVEARLRAYEKATTHQIAVLIVSSLDNEPIEDLAHRVASAWKLGQKRKDNGVLLVVALAERRVRIEVGKGLEGDLTDLDSAHIIRYEMKPLAQQERWHDAIVAGINGIERRLSGQPVGPDRKPGAHPRNERSSSNTTVGIIFAILLIAVIIGLLIRAIRGGRNGGNGGNGDSGGGGFFWFGGGGGFGGGDSGGSWGSGGGGDSGPSGGGGEFGGGGSSEDV